MVSIRPLSVSDLTGLQSLFGANSPDHPLLSRELQRPDVYLWIGLFDGNQLVAAHRSMLFGGWALLKGVSVATTHRGTTAAWRLAMAMKEAACARRTAGLAVWIEPHQPERFLATRLGIRQSGPLVHRFQMPLPDTDEDLANEDRAIDPSAPLAGSLQVSDCADGLVPDLLEGAQGWVSWVIDGRRIVLSGNPCRSAEELPHLLSLLRTPALMAGAHAAEIHLPASDLSAAFSIIASGISGPSRSSRLNSLNGMNGLSRSNRLSRLSRTPVRMGLSLRPPVDGAVLNVVEASA